MTKDKTLEDILHKLSGMSECHIEFREAKAEIIALVPKKSLIWKDRFGKPTDIFVLGESYYRDACADSWNDAIDATLEAFGGT